jgi:hypothetical protein
MKANDWVPELIMVVLKCIPGERKREKLSGKSIKHRTINNFK